MKYRATQREWRKWQGIASALCEFHDKITAILKPTPDKFLYRFSMRDICRTFESIALVPAIKMASPEKLIRLWAHETYRIYSDR